MGKLHRLDDNVYGVTELFHPSGSVNAGFIITNESIVHIDAGMTIADGNYLLMRSNKKAGKRANLVLILTHNHSDHIFGMRVFKEAGAKVIAHENLGKFLAPRTYYTWFWTVRDSYRALIIKLMIKRASYTKEKAEEILGDVKIFLPDEVLKEDKNFQMDGDELLLLYTPGHVPSEISVYHPKSKTLFAGDTIYEGMPLTTRFGGPKEWKLWMQSLEKLDELDIENIVPRHGSICGKDEIQRNIAYLENLLSQR